MKKLGLLNTLLLSLLVLSPFSAVSAERPKAETSKRSEMPQPMERFSYNSVEAIRKHYADMKLFKQNLEADAKARGEELPEMKTKLALGFLEAYLQYVSVRAYPNDQVDWTAYLRALKHQDQMTEMVTAANPMWQFVGPRGLAVPYRTYFGQGNISGRVNAIAHHPTNNSTYFIGAPQGGVMKTTDGGVTWTSLSQSWSMQQVGSIAVHPTNPNIIYVGTGDFQGWMRPYSNGVMKTTDGGTTWVSLGAAQFGNRCVSDILIDPENTNVITVTTGFGPYQGLAGQIWRSTNGGTSWSLVNNAANVVWSDLTMGIASGNTRYYYAVGHSGNKDVWRSSDRGATWTKLTTPLSASNQNALRIAASKVNANTVYLVSCADQNIWRSQDAGATWVSIKGTMPDPGWYQGWYDLTMAVSSRILSGNPVDVIYLGIVDLVQYDGATWRNINNGFTSSALIHIDIHSMAVNPNNANELLFGTDGGVYRVTYTPSPHSVTYTSLNNVLGITQFYWGDWPTSDLNWMLGGAQDNSTPTARGNLSSWANVGGGDGGYCAINPLNQNIQYATSQGLGVYRTTNGWSSSNSISPSLGSDRVPFIATIAINPANPNFLYAGTNYLWRWNESTQSWSARLGGQQLSASGTVLSIAAAPSDANRIYTGSTNGELWMSTNGGTSWTQINTGSPSLPNRAITSLKVHPTDPNRLYATMGGTGTGHLYLCVNTTAGTRVWTNLNGSGATALPDVHTNTVELDPLNPSQLIYVGNDIGVFYTKNGGATWSNGTDTNGLPRVQVNTLKAPTGTTYLNAATYGRGMWRIRLPFAPLAGDVDRNGCVNDLDLLRIVFRFGQTGSLPEDLNGDNIVNDLDFLEVLFNFGTGC
ncbi:MAG: hypothetical protein KIT45_14555 [Fimbriimonadia bacterium]|nr:hypothetical protein [Fimbriimonadia bacterium]